MSLARTRQSRTIGCWCRRLQTVSTVAARCAHRPSRQRDAANRLHGTYAGRRNLPRRGHRVAGGRAPFALAVVAELHRPDAGKPAREIHVQPRPGTKQLERKQGADAKSLQPEPAALFGCNGQDENLAFAGLQVLNVAIRGIRVQANAVAGALRLIRDGDAEIEPTVRRIRARRRRNLAQDRRDCAGIDAWRQSRCLQV